MGVYFKKLIAIFAAFNSALLFLRIPQLLMLFACIGVFVYGQPEFSGKLAPKIKDGVVDFSEWDFQNDGPVTLGGEWLFRWNEFVDPQTVSGLFASKESQFIQLPGDWKEYTKAESSFDESVGFCSYLLRLKGVNYAQLKLGVMLPAVGSAYDLKLINPETNNVTSLVTSGVVGTDVSHTIEQQESRLETISFESSSEATLMLYVSGFHHPNSKMEVAPRIGVYSDLRKQIRLNDTQRFFMSGIIFIMSIYCFSIFSTRTNDKASLWLGFFCLAFFMRDVALYGYHVLFFPEASVSNFETGVMLEYLGLGFGPGALMLFFYHSFPRFYNRTVMFFVVAVMAFVTALSTAFPMIVYAKFLPLFQFFTLFVVFYSTYGLINATRKGEEGAFLSLSAIIVMLCAVVNDILNNRFIISTTNLAGYAVLAFIFIQTQVISMKFSKAYKQAEMLSSYLKDEVWKKTASLFNKNKELENSTIQAKNLLRVVGHDIANPLSIILANVELTLMLLAKPGYEMGEETLKANLHRILRASKIQKEILGSVSDIISVKDGKKTLELSALSIDDVLKHVEFFFTEVVRDKNIKLNIESRIEEDAYVLAEKVGLNNNVLNNLITNAIKFSRPGDVVDFVVEDNDNQIVITLSDKGIGMPKELVANLFDFNKATSRKGTCGEKGTGYGMPIVKTYVDAFGGEIEVESKDIEEYPNDHGTSFILRLRRAEKSERAVHKAA